MALEYDVIRITAKTSPTGTQSYAHSLGVTPKLAIFLIPNADFDDSLENTFLNAFGGMGFGATDGTRQWCGFAGVEDAGTDHNAQRILRNDACIVSLDVTANTEQFRAAFSSWDSSNITLNWSNVADSSALAPAIYIILLGGTNLNVHVDTGTMRTSAGTQDYTGVANGKALITWAGGAITTLNSITANLGFSLGFSDDNGNAVARSCFASDVSNTVAFYSSNDASVLINDAAGVIAGRANGLVHNPSGAATFRLSWVDPATSGAHNFGYIHLGGSDLEATAGSQTLSSSHTVSTSGNRPRVILLSGNGVTTVNAGTVDDIMFSMGVTENIAGTENCVGFNINGASGTCSTTGRTDRALSHALTGGTTETNGATALSNSDTANNFNINKAGTGANLLAFFLALGEPNVTPQAVSGSSTNVGNLSTRIIKKLTLSGSSSNSGGLTTNVLDIIQQAVSGVCSNVGSLATLVKKTISLSGVSTNAGTLIKTIKKSLSGASTNIGALTTQTAFTARWSIEHLVANLNYDFPAVYVEVNSGAMPSGAFPSGEKFQKRVLSPLPVLEELTVDEEGVLTGFSQLELIVSNTDLFFLGKDLIGYYMRVWFVSGGGVFREFQGRISEIDYGFKTRIRIEQIEAQAITTKLPKRSVNATLFTHSNLPANDLGQSIPIIIGRQIKARLLYLKADEANREYDYLVGEGQGYDNDYFEAVTTVYREDSALDSIEGTMVSATSTTLVLETADRKPDSWYKYWWIEILTGTGAGQIRDVTAYDSAANRVTVSTWTTTPSGVVTYRLREWRFFDGSQVSPYSGFAFIRFKKRMGEQERTDTLYADVNGLQGERNPVRLIQALLSKSTWGLGLTIDSTSFNAAAALSAFTSRYTEGEIRNEADFIDIAREILRFRSMRLSFDEGITISVDQAKTSVATLKHERGDILTREPLKHRISSSQSIKTVTVKYRRNGKSGEYLHTLSRVANAVGIEKTIELPYIYDHTTADWYCDYWRKRFQSFAHYTDLEVGEAYKTYVQGQAVTLDIPGANINSEVWEILQTRVVIAGVQSWRLIPYVDAYTYESGTPESDVSFDIPPDYNLTNADPVSNVVVQRLMDIVGVTQRPYFKITWDTPEDNYGGALIRLKKTSEADAEYRHVVTVSGNNARIEGLTPGENYTISVSALNITGNPQFQSIAVVVTSLIAGGDTTAPNVPTGLTGDASLGVLKWTFTRSTSSDVWYHEYEIYSALSGGTLLKRGKIFADDSAEFSFTRNTGDLTTSLTAYATVRAVDWSNNVSAFISPRVIATTKDVGRDDIRDNATMDIQVAQVSSESPGVFQNIGTWYDVIDVTITTDRTGIVKVRYNGQWVPSGSGFALRLRRGSTTLKTITDIDSADKQMATLLDERSTAAGTYTYTIQTQSNVSGGVGLGLKSNTLSVQGDFK